MHRRAEHKAVGLLCQRQHVGHRPAKDAFAGLGAAAAAHAAAYRRAADVEDLGLDAVGLQGGGHFAQGGAGAAVFVRAAVDE